MYTSAFTTALFAALAAAHPLEPRHDSPNGLPPVVSQQNVNVLDLALYLEHLEQSLYTGGYTNFTEEQYQAEGFPAGFRDNVAVIADVRTLRCSDITRSLSNRPADDVPLA